MPYRKEANNEYLWKQMGLELEAVRLLLIDIVSLPELAEKLEDVVTSVEALEQTIRNKNFTE